MIITSFNNQGLPQPKKQAFKAISCNDKTAAKLHPEAFLQNRNLRQKELIKRLIQQDTNLA